jgi:AcrR family transcriptional regulator
MVKLNGLIYWLIFKMKKLDQNTEQKILKAAEDVFIKKGMAGARMQEIASTAGINKALLHYYYRTKERLFMAVFHVAVSQFAPKIFQIMVSEEISIFDRIRIFIEKYTQILLKNKFLPLFIIQEINRNPEKLVQIFMEEIEPQKVLDQIQKEIDKGNIRKMNPVDLIINMLSLVIFPIAASPMMQRVFYKNDKKAYKEYLKNRAKEVPEFIIQSIKPEK